MAVSRNIDRERFIALLNERFPEVAAKIDDISEGLLHLEMATFSRETQAAIDARDNETVAEEPLACAGSLSFRSHFGWP